MRKPRGEAPNARIDRVKNQTRFKAKKKVTFDLKPQICASPPHRHQNTLDLCTIRTQHNLSSSQREDATQCSEEGEGSRLKVPRAHSSDTEVYHMNNLAKRCSVKTQAVLANTLKLRPKKGCLKKRQESTSLTTLSTTASPYCSFSYTSLFSTTPRPPCSSNSEPIPMDHIEAANRLDSAVKTTSMQGHPVNHEVKTTSWPEHPVSQEHFGQLEEKFATMNISNKLATQINSPARVFSDASTERKSCPWSISTNRDTKRW